MPPGQGDRLGRYELVARLGAGASGEVWRAVLHGPEGFRRAVALKLLHAGPGEEDARALVAEARLGAGLQHPNLVAVHDLGRVDGRWFVAMELVDGASLAAAADAPLPAGAAIDAAIQACAALAHLHEVEVAGGRGIVHRDVKPANLLLDRYGVVKLADLGVARLSHEAGGVAGTPGYMAPEQALGAALDGRADLFAVGATLVRLVTGEHPFGAGVRALVATSRVEDRLRSGLLDPVEAAVPGLGPILHRCLRADPAGRWADARALAGALAGLRAGLGGPDLRDVLARARPDLRPGPAGPPSTRPRARAGDDGPTVAFAPGNLPAARDRFLGRDADVAAVSALVRSGERLISLLGPGGTGKTRLALAVARELAPDLPGGAWFFDLSAATRADELAAGVAGALGLPPDRADPVHQVGRALAYRGRCVVLLDNLEQAVDAAAGVLPRWLELAPEAQFLATSRVALRLTGERRSPVGPLAEDAAVELFHERAARPPAVAERPEVVALVRELDLSPLAIELAAARTRLLSVRTIRARLADRFALLVDGDRDRPERQRSLQASLDVSWGLLSERGRRALGELSVFAGPATLEAAEQVVELGGDHVLDALEELADASLVRVDADGERFAMSAAVRAYAVARREPDAVVAAEARHGAVFAAFGRPEALALLRGPGGLARGRELVAILDDLLAATSRAAARGDADVAARAFLAATEALLLRGPVARAAELAPDVLGLALTGRARVAVLHQLGVSLLSAGRFDAAAAPLAEALAHARALGDDRTEARILGRRAFAASLEGRRGDADAAVTAAIAAADRRRDAQVTAEVLRDAGAVAWAAGRFEEAARLFAESADRFRVTGDLRARAAAVMNLGLSELHRARLPEARVVLLEAHELLTAAGDRRNLGLNLVNLGMASEQAGRIEEARDSFARAARVLAEVGDERNLALAESSEGGALRELGRFPEAEDRLRRALAAQERIGDDRLATQTLWGLATLAEDQGRLGEARALLERAVERGRRSRHDRAVRQLAGKLAWLDFEQGVPGAERAADRAVAEARAAGDTASEVQTLAVAGAIRLRQGDARGALERLEAARALVDDPGAQLVFLADLGEARAAAGDPTGPELLDRAVDGLRAGGAREPLVRALLARARVSGAGAAADRAEARGLAAGLPPEAPLRRLVEAAATR